MIYQIRIALLSLIAGWIASAYFYGLTAQASTKPESQKPMIVKCVFDIPPLPMSALEGK